MTTTHRPQTKLYHYTCQHGYDALLMHGTLLPTAKHSPYAAHALPAELRELATMSWATDLEYPMRRALGLTSELLGERCDRTMYRYRIVDQSKMHHWPVVRKQVAKPIVELLEGAYLAMPMHWYVSKQPVTVQLDPIT